MIVKIDVTKCELEIKRHAMLRALERHITPDQIEATIKSGRIERFGKNNFRFVKRYKDGTVVCVDRLEGNTIIIVTIETR